MERKRTRILKTLSAVILVVGILMCLTGCLRYESRAKVNADGTVDFGFLYAIADISGSDSGSMDSAREPFERAGWEVEDYSEKGNNTTYNGFRANVRGVPIEELGDKLEQVGLQGLSIKEDNGVYTLQWDVSDMTSNATSQGVTGNYLTEYGGYMKFVLELPGKVIECNGIESDGGKRIEWDLLEMKSTVYAQFSLKGAGVIFPATTTITVNKDKTADVLLLFKDIGDVDVLSDLEDLEWEISGKSKVTAEKEGIALEDLQDELNAIGMGFENLEFVEDEGIYYLEWDAPDMEADVVLELPNAAEDSNSESEDEQALEWTLSDMEEPISAEFKIKGGGSNMLLLIGIIGGSAVVLCIIIVVIVVIAKKNKNKGPKPPKASKNEPAAPQAPAAPFGQPQQYVPQQPGLPQMQQYAPPAQQNPTAYNSASGFPNPGFPQVGSVPPQGQDNNTQM